MLAGTCDKFQPRRWPEDPGEGPLQRERLDREEIAGGRARRLQAQERPPRLLAALGAMAG
jgi:hypothetical protein